VCHSHSNLHAEDPNLAMKINLQLWEVELTTRAPGSKLRNAVAR